MNTFLGKKFPPDVRLHPTADQLPKAESWEQVHDYILHVRSNGSYAPEAYTLCLSDTSSKLSDVLLGSIPEAKEGVTGSHVFSLMMAVEKLALKHGVSLVGHCTDSTSNALSALLTLSSPSTYKHVVESITFLGLPRKDFTFFAPFLRPGFPSIAYPCWDHSGRTSVRNLMNSNIPIVAGILPSGEDKCNCTVWQAFMICLP